VTLRQPRRLACSLVRCCIDCHSEPNTSCRDAGTDSEGHVGKIGAPFDCASMQTGNDDAALNILCACKRISHVERNAPHLTLASQIQPREEQVKQPQVKPIPRTVPAWLATLCCANCVNLQQRFRHTPRANKISNTNTRHCDRDYSPSANHHTPVAKHGEACLARYHVRRRQDS